MVSVQPHEIEFHRQEFRRADGSPPVRGEHGRVAWTRVYEHDDEVLADYAERAEEVRALLGPDAARAPAGLGRGAGVFLVHAVRYFRAVPPHAASRGMLQCARSRTRGARLTNIAFHRAEGSSGAHEAGPVDVVVSVAAVSHVPDFWRLVGPRRPGLLVRPDNRCHLLDVVTCLDLALCKSRLQSFTGFVNGRAGLGDRGASVTNLWAEYRTCHQIIEDLFSECGFDSGQACCADELLAVYTCTTETPQEAPIDVRERIHSARAGEASVPLPGTVVGR